MRRSLALLLLLAGCADSLGPEDVPSQPDAPLQTSALSYTLEDDGTVYHTIVPATYVNRTSAPVYEGWCTRVLERKAGKAWVTALAIPCPSVFTSPPPTYAPGVSYQISFSVWAAHEPNTAPNFADGPIPGIYRYRIGLYATATPSFSGLTDLSNLLPLSARITNEFWIALPAARQ